LGIEPFDQPDVERAKVETRRVLAEASGSGVFVYPEQENASTASSVLADAIAAVDDTGYIAVQAYLQPTDATNASIAGLRERIAARTTRPVTTGYGPRFLHSTGQLHKGGPVGLCVQLVDRPDPTEVPIPGEWFGFGHLITAQALGDFMALRGLGRPVLRLQVPSTNPSEAIDTIFA
jgi:hypothetical protein